MSTDQDQSSTRSNPQTQPTEFEVGSAAATRRRLLLKGIGKGSAVVAAAVPIKSLAFTSSVTAGGQICSVSGVQSAAHSGATGLPTCGGLSPGYYKKLKHWPNYNGSATPPTAINTVGFKTFTENTAFSAVFGGGSTRGMLDIMQNAASTPEFHWIPALLNAIKAPPGYVFPYSAQEVLDLYLSAQQAAALDFFKGYMETL